jgi:hypothetical protein
MKCNTEFTVEKRKTVPIVGNVGSKLLPVRYEHHLHIKTTVIPITGCGDP